MSEQTQLTTAAGYNTARLIFSEPQEGTIPNSVPQIVYKRINIQTRNEDGTIGDLILPTERLFSFGVSENTNPDNGKVNGYVMPHCMWSRDGATDAEKAWTDSFDAIVETCKDHLLEIRESIGQFDLERIELKKLNPFYYKRDKGKIVQGTGPTLYSKLIVSKKHDKIITIFFDSSGNEINPLDLLGKYCYTTSAIKIESIFIGNKISLQVKLYEAEVQLVESGMKRLLTRPQAESKVTMQRRHIEVDESGGDDDSGADGSVKGSDEESDSENAAGAVGPAAAQSSESKPAVRRVVRKVVKKSSK